MRKNYLTIEPSLHDWRYEEAAARAEAQESIDNPTPPKRVKTLCFWNNFRRPKKKKRR